MNEREPTGRGTDRGRDAREDRLRALLQAAYPAAEPDEALERSVSELVAQHTARAGRRRGWWQLPSGWRERSAWSMGAAAAVTLLAVLGLMRARQDHRQSTQGPGSHIAGYPHPPRSAPGLRLLPPTPRNDRSAPIAVLPPIQPGKGERSFGPSMPASAGTAQRGTRGSRAMPRSNPRYQPAGPPRSAHARAGDDMAYVNRDPEQAIRPWLTMQSDEWDRIEAQVRREVRVKDDFVKIPFPRLASTAPRQIVGAVESYKREAAVVDSRLFRKVTLALKGASLDDFCAALQAQTGVPFHAARGVGDDKVTVFIDNQPAREVMRAIVRLFGYTWSRTHREDGYRYELLQDLRSQLAEEALRNSAMSAALLALDRAMQAYQPYMDQSIDQLKARLTSAKGAESQRLRQLVWFGGWAGVRLYDRLTPAERAALLSGQPLVFSVDAIRPDRRLPAEWVRPILQSVNQSVITPRPALETSASLADTPGVTLSTVGLQLDRSDLGRLVLEATLDTAGPKEGGSVHRTLWLADGTGPAMDKPDNAAANRAWQRQSAFQRAVSLRPEPSCARLRGDRSGATQGADPEERARPWAFSSDVWEAVHRATGQQIVADFYTHLYPAAAVTVEGTPLFGALCRAGDAMDVRWRKEGDFLLCRSSSFFWDRLKEVPNRYLERWQQEQHDQGGLPLDALLEMASFPDYQLSGVAMDRAIVDCWGLPEWHIVAGQVFHPRIRQPGISPPDIPGVQVRTYTHQFPWLWIRFWYPHDLRAELRFFGTLTPEQRHRVLQPEGLAFAALTPEQQRGFLQLWEQVEGLREQQSGQRSGMDPQELVNARFSAEYIPAGWYYWSPPYTQPEPHPRVLPRVAGRTAAEALAAARRIDPNASPDRFQQCLDGEFAPSIWIGAIPTLGNTARRRE